MASEISKNKSNVYDMRECSFCTMLSMNIFRNNAYVKSRKKLGASLNGTNFIEMKHLKRKTNSSTHKSL